MLLMGFICILLQHVRSIRSQFYANEVPILRQKHILISLDFHCIYPSHTQGQRALRGKHSSAQRRGWAINVFFQRKFPPHLSGLVSSPCSDFWPRSNSPIEGGWEKEGPKRKYEFQKCSDAQPKVQGQIKRGQPGIEKFEPSCAEETGWEWGFPAPGNFRVSLKKSGKIEIRFFIFSEYAKNV